MKTRHLTQISLRNDPINRRMHGFSFWVSEDEVWSSRCEFFFLFRSEFDFKGSMGAEMHQDYKETNGTWIGVYTRRIWWKSTGAFFRREELNLKRDFWAQPSDLMDSSRSTVAMRCRFYESASLFDDRWITDVGSRWDLIAWRRRGFDFDRSLDFDPTIAMWRWIHRFPTISAVITDTINRM